MRNVPTVPISLSRHRFEDQRRYSKRSWRMSAVVLAVGFGAFCEEQVWPVWQAHKVLQADDVGSKTPRTLVLIETSPGENGVDGTARLGTSPDNPQTYSVGAILLNGARLTQIHADYVVLERGRESARLYIRSNVSPVSAAENRLLQVGGSNAADNVPPTVAPTSDPRTASITTFVRPNPVFKEGSLRGFALQPGLHPEVFSKLGLVAGDVLTQINGVSVTDTEQVMDMLEQFTAGSAFEITIERQKEMQGLTLDGSVITNEQH